MKVADPERVVLFGSMADGRSNAHSDVDLLIVVREGAPRAQVASQVGSFASELCLQSDVLVHTETDLEQARGAPHSFLGAIMRSGRIVYERGLGLPSGSDILRVSE